MNWAHVEPTLLIYYYRYFVCFFNYRSVSTKWSVRLLFVWLEGEAIDLFYSARALATIASLMHACQRDSRLQAH